MTLSKMGSPHVPQHYVLPPLQRQNSSTTSTTAALPIIDLSSLHDPSRRFLVINDIRRACMEVGNFQVINHGIPLQLMKDALDAATHFFNLPQEDKMLLLSDNIHEPVRYGTSLNHAIDKVYYWRDFIKHYSNPLSAWIHLWPENPSNFVLVREKMGNYAMAVQNLQVQLMEIVLQSLGLKRDYMQDEITEGQQVMAVNYYPACPEPQFVLGMPPHTDFGSLTILLQSSQGLEYMDCNQNWVSAPAIEGALIVQLGDQLEVMTNGRYKSVNHRVTVNAEQNRISIASLHSLALNKKIRPAPELVDDQNPASIKIVRKIAQA